MKRLTSAVVALLFAWPAWALDDCTIADGTLRDYSDLIDSLARRSGALTPAETLQAKAMLEKFKQQSATPILRLPTVCAARAIAIKGEHDKLYKIAQPRLAGMGGSPDGKDCENAAARLNGFVAEFESLRKQSGVLSAAEEQTARAAIDKFTQENAKPELNTPNLCFLRDKAISVEWSAIRHIAGRKLAPPDTVTPAYWACMVANIKAQGDLAALWDRAIRDGKDAVKTFWWSDNSIYLDQMQQNLLYRIGKAGNMQVVDPTYRQNCEAVGAQIAKMRHYLEAAQ